MSNQDMSEVRLLTRIVEGLQQKPAYLLIFGICVLFVMFGFGAGTYGVIKDKTVPLYLSFFSFVIALIVAVIVVRIVELSGLPPEERKALQFQKLMYVKILHLSRMEEGKNPVYRRVIDRLGGEKVPVFDEAVYYSLNIFSQQQQQYSCTVRSSGIVDLRIGHPWMEKLEFPDQGAQFIKNIVNQTVKEPSSAYFIVAHLYNGLQPGHEDIAMRMDQDTQSARLVIDFSSIPNSQLLFKQRPKAVLRTGSEEKPIGIIEYPPAIFSTAQKDLEEGQVLRIDFKIDWDKVQY